MGQSRQAQRVLMGKAGGKRPLEKPGSRCKDNIKTKVARNWLGGRGSY